MNNEPFDAVLAEMRQSNTIMYADELADRLAAAHAAEVGERDADIFHLRDDLTDAIARANAAVGLLRERIYDVETYADEVKWSELARTFLAEQARVGGENGNG